MRLLRSRWSLAMTVLAFCHSEPNPMRRGNLIRWKGRMRLLRACALAMTKKGKPRNDEKGRNDGKRKVRNEKKGSQ